MPTESPNPELHRLLQCSTEEPIEGGICSPTAAIDRDLLPETDRVTDH
ncbi:MAG: hypothetical protein ABL921_20940 [Pirellula sp.]